MLTLRFLIGGKQYEREAIDRVTMLGRCRLAIILQSFVFGSFNTLASLISKTQKVLRFGIALFRKRLGKFDSFEMTSALEGLDGFFDGTLNIRRQACNRLLARQRDCRIHIGKRGRKA